MGFKSKAKTKHLLTIQKIVIDNIKDTDDDVDDIESDIDMNNISNSDFCIGPPSKKVKPVTSNQRSTPPLLYAEGNPMFDPKLIFYPNSTEWLPSDHIADYITAKLCLPLDKQVHAKLRSECPSPSLPLHITSTPSVDSSMITFFSKFGKDPRKGVDRAWSVCQDKVLDIVGLLARIFDMVELSRLNNDSIDPEELSLWIQQTFCLLGNANSAMIHKRQKGLLLKLGPKLANFAAMDPGPKADGLLFGDSFIKELIRYVTTFASFDKVQQSLKKVFNAQVFARAGPGGGRYTGRYARYQGYRGSFNSQQDSHPQFYPQRSRGFRGRNQHNSKSYTPTVSTKAPATTSG
ncbi:uncharacterized protein [Pleurodeles waltl]|uniref:uncharacterized protein n=1 Tax=Pleurodeles waltl TaxID=8319 RepID=UPI0037098766